ncbi:F-box/LRR-repeat protein 15-like [Mytilus californianus]|uniref:F-box/LRR-repeat protein 15-like n=1 Tax=Mytilus californianus TaxID=6549 RepID=UPI0022453A0E|nr:F-box/LRR-repeat protein 15-like [Mytilus californianus]
MSQEITEGTVEDLDKDQDDSTEVIGLFHLPWEDIIFRYIMPCLPLPTQFKLRIVSKDCKELVGAYFRSCKTCNICRVVGQITAKSFVILTEDNTSFTSLVLRNAQNWLTDGLLLPVLEHNSKLQKIDLTHCSSISNSCLHTISIKCSQLTTLSLRECHWVSEAGITVVLMNCPNLKQLDLTGCWLLNDDTVMLIAQVCKNLKFLSIAKIYGVTDFALNVLAKTALSLQHLNVQGCWRLTNSSIIILGEYGKCLEALQVRDCRDITEASLARLRTRGIKIDVRPPPEARNLNILHNALGLRQRLNVQI